MNEANTARATWLGTPGVGPGATTRPGGRPEAGTTPLLVDCDRCSVRGDACTDCVVSVLLGPPGDVALDGDEQAALAALAGSGLVPPLRLVTPAPPRSGDPSADPWDDPWGNADAPS